MSELVCKGVGVILIIMMFLYSFSSELYSCWSVFE